MRLLKHRLENSEIEKTNFSKCLVYNENFDPYLYHLVLLELLEKQHHILALDLELTALCLATLNWLIVEVIVHSTSFLLSLRSGIFV